MQVGGGAKSVPSEGGRGWRNRMISQMVTEIVSEAKAGHFAGLVPVILPLLDGGSSQRNGTTGDPNESAHPVVNSPLTHVCRLHVSPIPSSIGLGGPPDERGECLHAGNEGKGSGVLRKHAHDLLYLWVTSCREEMGKHLLKLHQTPASGGGKRFRSIQYAQIGEDAL